MSLESDLNAIQRFCDLENLNSAKLPTELLLLADAIRNMSSSLLFSDAYSVDFRDHRYCDAETLMLQAKACIDQASHALRMAANALNRSWDDNA